MKTQSVFVLTAVLIGGLANLCKPVPLEWERVSESPVLDIGGPSPYESYHVATPCVLIEDGVYKMWYSGYHAGAYPRTGFCYATSTDRGQSWAKHGTVLEVTESWEGSDGVNYPTVMHDEGVYRMWYGTAGDKKICYVSSVDGITWEPANKVLQLGPGYYFPSVCKGPTGYKLYYGSEVTSSVAIAGPGKIYCLESDDGGISDPWEPVNGGTPVLQPSPGEWDSDHLFQSCCVRYDVKSGQYQMWYAGSGADNVARIGFALSADGIMWGKVGTAPVLEPMPGTWQENVSQPFIVFDEEDNTYRMFYRGAKSGWNYAIGLAVAPEPPCWQEQAKLLASDAAGGDMFGVSVAVDGDHAIVGADGDDDNGNWAGAAYIFKREGPNWIEQTKLTASDGAAGDRFGLRVSISGDYAVIGAANASPSGSWSGAAYIFKRSAAPNDPNWYQKAKLTASDGAAYDDFGISISISGDYVIVGAQRDDINGLGDVGSAYIFEKPPGGWVNMTETAKVTASDGGPGDIFGCSVSIGSDYAIVGGCRHDTNGLGDSGSAYIFKKPATGWVDMTETVKLTAPNPAAHDSFGAGVSISGDEVIVGAPGDDSFVTLGSAYIFRRDLISGSWVQQAKLTASDGSVGDCFGCNLQLSGNYAVMSAHCDDGFTGSAYVFKRDGESWSQVAKLTASDRAANDNFGFGGISWRYVIVGSPGDDDGGSDSGSAYVFENICEPTPIRVALDIKPTSCPNPLNVESKGTLPVAILGTEDFDVNQIDIASVRLEGVAPIRSNYEDVETPVTDSNECDCNTAGPDGYTDLTLKFDTPEIAGALGDVNDGDAVPLSLTGALSDETPIEGADCIVVVGKVPRWIKAKKSDVNEDGVIDLRDFCLMAEYWLEASSEED